MPAVSGTTSDMVGPQPREPIVKALLRGLRELGNVYGQDFVTEPRAGESRPERFPSLAAELVRLPVGVIVAAGPMLPSLKQATSTIPIVTADAVDPVDEGLAQSLGHPGGNFTGPSNQSVELTGKRLGLLKEFVPTAALVSLRRDQTSRLNSQAAEAAARERGWKLLSLGFRDAGEIGGAFGAAAGARAGALLLAGGGLLYPQSRRIVELAATGRLPAMYPLRPSVEAGGLISHGADITEIWGGAAVLVDKILKGSKPADLPVEQPSRFQLVINLKTAQALGLVVPQSILIRADEVVR